MTRVHSLAWKSALAVIGGLLLNSLLQAETPTVRTSQTYVTTLWEFSPSASHHAAVVSINTAAGNGGSGCYVEHEGLRGVLTCAHLKAAIPTVTWSDGTKTRGQFYTDLYHHDAAFVATTHPTIKPLRLAVRAPQVGDRIEICSYGGPQRRLRHFWGAVSSTSMRLQLQANVTPGDSGGPILNTAGEVVGIQSTGAREVARSGDFPVYAGAASPGYAAITQFVGRVRARLCPGGT